MEDRIKLIASMLISVIIENTTFARHIASVCSYTDSEELCGLLVIGDLSLSRAEDKLCVFMTGPRRCDIA